MRQSSFVPMLSRSCRAVLVGLALLSPLSAQDAEQEYDELQQAAEQKLLHGDLLLAQRTFEELFEALSEDRASPDDRHWTAVEVGLATIELRRGNYEQASEALSKLPKTARERREVRLVLAEARLRLGDQDTAIAALQDLVGADAEDRQARHLLGEALLAAGLRGRAREAFAGNAALPPSKDPVQLAWQGRSLFLLGGRDNYERASRLLVDSMQAAPEHPVARTTLGELKFVAYGEASGFPSGEKDLKKVLEVNGESEQALLAMYRIRSANMVLDAGKTEDYLDRALDRNPRCVEARLLRAANVIDDRRFDAAARLLDEALLINARHRELLAHRAAAALLLDESADYEMFRERALAGDPGWPEVDRILGDHLVALYRFADAVPYYEAALRDDPNWVPALHGLAKAMIYVGRGERARELLQQAQELQKGLNDPWRNNAIAVQELLEKEYDVVEAGPFSMLLHRQDDEVLRAYLLPIQLEAAEVLGRKYGWSPEAGTRVEVLHTWDDFSVRTIGFRGFTALGACFGRLITLVSPVDGDLRKQDFMWEATAWHEYTHVLTLGLSRHRVPRWLTEGFSVYEERSRDVSWERGMTRELFDAFHNQDIPPVHLLNRLFRGPRILFGYYQGGLIVELISKRHGFDKALELLRGFGDDLSLEATFQRAIGTSSQSFDRQLLEYVEKELLRGVRLVPRYSQAAFQRLVAAARNDANDLDTRVALAWASVQNDNPIDAGRWLAEVLRVAPDHAGAQLVRAELLRRRGAMEDAVVCWQAGFAGGADDFDSRIAFGDALLGLGDADSAIDQWQRAKACWPGCTEQATAPELRLAKVYEQRGERTQAQMEMKSYVRRTARAFAPRLRLAEFERDAGNRQEELRLLLECNRIDPFDRQLHVRMGEACEALGRQAEAAREFEVAAAVMPEQDRAYLAPDAERPDSSSPEQRDARGQLWLRAARLRHRLGDVERRDQLVQRILDEVGDTPAADAARDARQEWRGR